MGYSHTQHAPLHYIFYAIAAVMGAVAWSFDGDPVGTALATVLAGLMVLLGLSFRSLTVTDHGDSLSVRFGPLPFFGTSIRYADITKVERARSSFIDGWGIHYLPRRGWIYNLWGFDCVTVTCGSKIIRIGTDDVDNLTGFLHSKVPGFSPSS